MRGRIEKNFHTLTEQGVSAEEATSGLTEPEREKKIFCCFDKKEKKMRRKKKKKIICRVAKKIEEKYRNFRKKNRIFQNHKV
jgi:hypothetical protein